MDRACPPLGPVPRARKQAKNYAPSVELHEVCEAKRHRALLSLVVAKRVRVGRLLRIVTSTERHDRSTRALIHRDTSQ